MSERYPLVLILAIVLAFLWLALGERRLAPREQPFSPATLLDAALAAVALGLVGGRLAFVLGHLNYFSRQPLSALYLWDGGLQWAGAALGALLGTALVSWGARAPFWPLAAALSPPAALVAFGAWLGCLLDRCAYGRALSSAAPWLIQRDWFGQPSPRWPVQAMGSVASLIILLVVARMRMRHWPPVPVTLSALGLLAGAQFGLSFLRGDPMPVVRGMRGDALASLLVLVIALGLGAGRQARRLFRRRDV